MRTGCLFFLNLTSDVPLELTNCPGGSHPLPGSCNFLSFTQLFIFLFLVMNIGKKKKEPPHPAGTTFAVWLQTKGAGQVRRELSFTTGIWSLSAAS